MPQSIISFRPDSDTWSMSPIKQADCYAILLEVISRLQREPGIDIWFVYFKRTD